MGRPHRWNASAFLRSNSFGTVRHHQDVTLLPFTDCSPFVAAVHHQFQGNKKPCFQSGSRVRRKLFSLRHYLLARCLIEAQPITGLTRQPTESDCTAFNRPIMTCRGQGDLSHRPVRGGYVHASFHRTWETNITSAWLQSTYTSRGRTILNPNMRIR